MRTRRIWTWMWMLTWEWRRAGGVEATALDAASPNGGRVDEVAISVNDLEVLEKAELRGVTAAMF